VNQEKKTIKTISTVTTKAYQWLHFLKSGIFSLRSMASLFVGCKNSKRRYSTPCVLIVSRKGAKPQRLSFIPFLSFYLLAKKTAILFYPASPSLRLCAFACQ
jgi:hypothetical protein